MGGGRASFRSFWHPLPNDLGRSATEAQLRLAFEDELEFAFKSKLEFAFEFESEAEFEFALEGEADIGIVYEIGSEVELVLENQMRAMRFPCP